MKRFSAQAVIAALIVLAVVAVVPSARHPHPQQGLSRHP